MAYGDVFEKGDRVQLLYPDDINVHERRGTVIKIAITEGRVYYVQLDNKVGVMALDDQLTRLDDTVSPVETFSVDDYDID